MDKDRIGHITSDRLFRKDQDLTRYIGKGTKSEAGKQQSTFVSIEI